MLDPRFIRVPHGSFLVAWDIKGSPAEVGLEVGGNHAEDETVQPNHR